MEKYRQYVDFLGLMSLSNNLRVQVTEHAQNYVLFVGKGNNSSLIKTLFKTYRPWWTVEENRDSPNINLFWFQLRQSDILDNFKENNKSELDFQECSYYAEKEEQEEKESGMGVSEREVKREPSRNSNNRKKTEIRSHSVTQKDLKATLRMGRVYNNVGLTKRSSSKTKGTSQEKSNQISYGLFGLKKDVKEDI